jgi:hypothetical protein
VFVSRLVDGLPVRLWAPGNLYILPGGNWHFCVGSHPRLDHSVRTVEWRGRQVAHGERPFDAYSEDAEDIGQFRGFWRWGYYPGAR